MGITPHSNAKSPNPGVVLWDGKNGSIACRTPLKLPPKNVGKLKGQAARTLRSLITKMGDMPQAWADNSFVDTA